MDKNVLKKYAPQARKDFIAAITDRAGHYGLTNRGIAPVTVEGNVALIHGRPFPRSVAIRRIRLENRIEGEGFDQVMEAIAYTWFNRFVAIRYMELHGYLDHGYRVISHPEGKPLPEILEHAEHLHLPGINPKRVIELKLAGDKEAELYRMLLVAQCNALHEAMPFLFEKIDDETELLLPENLLHSDSLIRKLVNTIPEADWQEIEVIGWIYQFYISEKKDEVIGKVVKTEDIPAATQLFTPNWIVKYLVQNSIGRQWLATYPQSSLRDKMEYYIESPEQTPEVQAQLKAITPNSLNPEEMTLLDPACGSGHILVEAYDLFKALYQERGYRAKDIPRLILRNNLFGLEIDERAAQLASFALIMKARADDRRVLEGGIRMNIRCIQSSDGISAEEVYEALTGVDVVDKSGLPPSDEFDFSEEQTAPLFAHLRQQSSSPSSPSSLAPSPYPLAPSPPLAPSLQEIRALLALFKGDDAKTFGSLIRIPKRLAKLLPELVERTDRLVHGDDLSRQRVAQRFAPIAEQALLLARQYDAVVTNPPYIGGKGQNPKLKAFLKDNYTDVKSDIFSAFMLRNCELAKAGGQLGFMSPFVWMFISSYEKLRDYFITQKTITSLVQLEYSGFDGATVPICTFTLENAHHPTFKGGYIKLSDFRGADNQAPKTLEAIANPDCGWFYRAAAQDFKMIPGSPIAYWVSDKVKNVFSEGTPFGGVGFPKVGMQTSNNDIYLRLWTEVSYLEFIDEAMPPKWIKYLKGGSFRRWYGNLDYLLRYNKDPQFIKQQPNATVLPETKLKEAKCTWTDLTSGSFNARFVPDDTFHDISGHCFYPPREKQMVLLAYCNTKQFNNFLSLVNASFHFQVGDVAKVPVLQVDQKVQNLATRLISLSKSDWDAYERSWDFTRIPLLHPDHHHGKLRYAYASLRAHWREMTLEMQRLEEENNRLFIEAYGLQDEMTPEVPLKEITLTCNPHYRYGGDKSEEELETLLRTDTVKELLSYAVGCMMGRYSLDEPGLVYAHSGNEGFDPARYKTFPADDDGIIPLTDYEWFEDDATNRFVEFIGVAWPKEHLEENLNFVAESLGPKRGEDARSTIRRYFATGFFKDHLKTYKKRPIYWLFSSGKQRAFQCLVYLHRYNEGTLSRMRTEYMIPLQGKMAARIDRLAADIAASTSTSQRNRYQKEQDTLRKQLAELRNFDETLRHYADQRISLDLDDGVKVNYGKFGGLLAEVKAVTGSTPEED
jgi:type II restriction/modification system DNA methylase subunit YeeA